MTFDEFLLRACPPLDLEWRKYRRRAARHRVQTRMQELGIYEYGEYLQRLQSDEAEKRMFPEIVLVTVSRFFRERECWEDLEYKVIPELLGKKERGMLHVWSAGCCGGEEPYTLAILWLARLQERYPGWGISILATDIDDISLARAQKGEYGEGSLREVPQQILHTFFRRDDSLWRMSDDPRLLVSLRKHNLLNDSPPGQLDMVFCRYLAFTYFRGKHRQTAMERIVSALRPGGTLVIGLKESLLEGEYKQFEAWEGVQGVFKRR